MTGRKAKNGEIVWRWLIEHTRTHDPMRRPYQIAEETNNNEKIRIGKTKRNDEREVNESKAEVDGNEKKPEVRGLSWASPNEALANCRFDL